jgi:hypothetical protein
MPSVKEIYSRISDVTIDADSINLNTDTVESLLSTVQADIALVKTDIANGVLSDLRDGTGNAITSSARGSQRALSVQIVDGSGNQVTTFGSASVSVSNFPATQAVSGTVTANNQALTTGTGTASGTSAVGTDLITSTDVSGFAEASIQFTGVWPVAATVSPQISNDNSTWLATTLIGVSTTTPTLVNSFTSTQLSTWCRVGLFGARYFRLRVTGAGSSGTYDFAYTFNPRSTSLNAQPVNIISSTALAINPSTGNGFSTHHTAISAASTNATNVKSSVPSIGSITISNTSASIRYFKIFNLTVAPTMGTSTPVLNYAIMPNSTMAIDCSFAGIRLSSGLSYAITAGQALLDNTAVGAGDVVVNISYA